MQKNPALAGRGYQPFWQVVMGRTSSPIAAKFIPHRDYENTEIIHLFTRPVVSQTQGQGIEDGVALHGDATPGPVLLAGDDQAPGILKIAGSEKPLVDLVA